ncbi:hypothetical protein [Hespellia stercorisuis]|uniref:ABC-2 type transport system permease protein n=1 Tax=Hespellia stercorisuis DSM 15480 TaxID=1121950 RepID=A0A1M6IC76_9FIRM|nr:hypothetical protein [Hespellia stercorisuis]SHJ32038.1 ABC-2 type transport system permease protein [Hespellia stercorisuis DSM 15480]
MPGKLFTLLLAQYKNQSSLNVLRHETDTKKKHRMMGVYAGMAIVFVMMVGYSFAIAYGYGYLKMAYVIPGYSLAISSIIALVFTFVKTNGFLFAFKDYDMVMALPVSTKTVITAKFLYMYINNLIFSLCVMIPMCAGYAIWERPGVRTWLIWLIGACFAPLIPMSLAALAGALIAAIGSRFRFKVFVQVVLTLLLLAAAFSLNFIFTGAGSNAEFFQRMENLGELLEAQIHKLYPVSVIFDRAVNESSVLYLLLFLLLSFGIYVLFVSIVAVKYKAINTALMTGSSHSNYKVSKMESRSMMHALVRKEWKRFTSSVIYLTNVGMGVLLAVSGSVICVFIGIDKVLASMEIGGMQQGFLYAAPFAVAMMLTMTCTTSVSWSLEGKNLWIVKSLPIEESMIFKSKMAFNLLLLVPAALVCDICFAISLKLNIVMTLLYLVVLFAAVVFSTTFGMWAGKKFANFEWENEVEIIKQGLASMLGIFVNMLLEIALAVAAFFLSTLIDGRIVMALFAAVLGFMSVLFYRSVCSFS